MDLVDFGRFARWAVVPSLLVVACLDSNPHLDASEGTEGGSTTGGASVDESTRGDSTPSTGTIGTTATDDTGSAVTSEGTTDRAEDDPDTESEGPWSCPSSHRCVGAVPDDWNGPVIVHEGAVAETLAECGSAYPELVAEHATDPTGSAATCTCSCGSVAGATCTHRIAGFEKEMCVWLEVWEIHPRWTPLPTLNGCVDTPTSTNAHWSLQAVPEGGSCTPSSNKSVPNVTYQRQIRLCGSQEWVASGCEESEICVPDPEESGSSNLCIHREGEHDCPDGPYDQRSVHHVGHTDTRDCSPACTCAEPEGSCTGAAAALYRDNDTCTAEFCTNPPCTVVKDQGCSVVPMTQVRSVRRTADATYSGSCAKEGFQPVGDVIPADPVTVCCTG